MSRIIVLVFPINLEAPRKICMQEMHGSSKHNLYIEAGALTTHVSIYSVEGNLKIMLYHVIINS